VIVEKAKACASACGDASDSLSVAIDGAPEGPIAVMLSVMGTKNIARPEPVASMLKSTTWPLSLASLAALFDPPGNVPGQVVVAVDGS
jgi:hypothetical protein